MLISALQSVGLIEVPADASRPIADFGDPLAEYQAAWTSTAIIPEHGFGMLTVTGNDRAKFLHNFCTQDIKVMQSGDFREAFFCNVKGRILAVGVILCEDDCIRVLTDESRVDFLHQHLDKYIIMEDVQVQVEETVQPLLLVGSMLEPDSLGSCSLFSWNIGFRPAAWLLGSSETLVKLTKTLLDSQAVIAGHSAWEIIRLTAAYPRYDADVSEDNLAQEANRTEQAISFTKGCYLGQEPIARLDAMGHVNRQLERFVWYEDSETPPVVGKPVLNENGDEVGTVTSACQIPEEHRGFVLAMVKVKELAGALSAENADGQRFSLRKE